MLVGGTRRHMGGLIVWKAENMSQDNLQCLQDTDGLSRHTPCQMAHFGLRRGIDVWRHERIELAMCVSAQMCTKITCPWLKTKSVSAQLLPVSKQSVLSHSPMSWVVTARHVLPAPHAACVTFMHGRCAVPRQYFFLCHCLQCLARSVLKAERVLRHA